LRSSWFLALQPEATGIFLPLVNKLAFLWMSQSALVDRFFIAVSGQSFCLSASLIGFCC
jgi:hypothetical protein